LNPKIRNINAFPVQVSGQQMILIQDPLHFSEKPVAVTQEVFFIISLFDGENSILDIQEQYTRKYGDILFSSRIKEIIGELDSNFLMESERFERYKELLAEEFSASSIRGAFHAGNAYQKDVEELKGQLHSFFISEEGPGEFSEGNAKSNEIKGIVAPHIDLTRGGTCYAYAYKEIAEKCDAELFVIFGTSHSPAKNQFILTMKDFQTPLGVMATDKEFVKSLSSKYPSNLFEDELIHKYEHSIEFQVIFLQYVLRNKKNAKIVPILCSSFYEVVEKDIEPSEFPPIRDFISLMKDSLERYGKPVCFIAGADLSHVGKKFGDQEGLSYTLLENIRDNDLEMLNYVEKMDAKGFFDSIEKDQDSRRICGFPPIYMLLSIIKASQGKLLKYSQAREQSNESVVSFASMAFS
jgi:AmmeMemoRadiSam system protein B